MKYSKSIIQSLKYKGKELKSFVSCYINVRSDPFRLKNIFFKLVLWFWNLIVCWDSKITKKKGGEIIRFGNKCIILMSKSVELIIMILCADQTVKHIIPLAPSTGLTVSFFRLQEIVFCRPLDNFRNSTGIAGYFRT